MTTISVVLAAGLLSLTAHPTHSPHHYLRHHHNRYQPVHVVEPAAIPGELAPRLLPPSIELRSGRDVASTVSSADRPSFWTTVPYGPLSLSVRFTTDTIDLERVTQVQVLLDGCPLAPRSQAGELSPPELIEPNVWLHTYTFSISCPPLGKHLIEAHYKIGELWSGLSTPLRFEVRAPERPQIISAADSNDAGGPLPKAGVVRVRTGALRLKLAHIYPGDQLIAYIGDKIVDRVEVNDECCVEINLYNDVTPGIYALAVRAIPSGTGCQLASRLSTPIHIHYDQHDDYLLKPGRRPATATQAITPVDDVMSSPRLHHNHRLPLGEPIETPRPDDQPISSPQTDPMNPVEPPDAATGHLQKVGDTEQHGPFRLTAFRMNNASTWAEKAQAARRCRDDAQLSIAAAKLAAANASELASRADRAAGDAANHAAQAEAFARDCYNAAEQARASQLRAGQHLARAEAAAKDAGLDMATVGTKPDAESAQAAYERALARWRVAESEANKAGALWSTADSSAKNARSNAAEARAKATQSRRQADAAQQAYQQAADHQQRVATFADETEKGLSLDQVEERLRKTETAKHALDLAANACTVAAHSTTTLANGVAEHVTRATAENQACEAALKQIAHHRDLSSAAADAAEAHANEAVHLAANNASRIAANASEILAECETLLNQAKRQVANAIVWFREAELAETQVRGLAQHLAALPQAATVPVASNAATVARGQVEASQRAVRNAQANLDAARNRLHSIEAAFAQANQLATQAKQYGQAGQASETFYSVRDLSKVRDSIRNATAQTKVHIEHVRQRRDEALQIQQRTATLDAAAATAVQARTQAMAQPHNIAVCEALELEALQHERMLASAAGDLRTRITQEAFALARAEALAEREAELAANVDVINLAPAAKPPEQALRRSFYFAAPAHFPLRGFGPQGDVYDLHGALIYEDMEFAFNENGDYEITFRVGTPAVPTTLKLQFIVDCGEGTTPFPITLEPLYFPAATVEHREIRPAVVHGRSEILRRRFTEIADIRRDGTAQFGFGLRVLGRTEDYQQGIR